MGGQPGEWGRVLIQQSRQTQKLLGVEQPILSPQSSAPGEQTLPWRSGAPTQRQLLGVYCIETCIDPIPG